MHKDGADLDVGISVGITSTGRHAHNKHQSEKQRKKLFHLFVPPIMK